ASIRERSRSLSATCSCPSTTARTNGSPIPTGSSWRIAGERSVSPKKRKSGMAVRLPQAVCEAGVRRAQVQHPELARAGVAEPVHRADRRRDEAARAEAVRLAVERELGLALEHEEAVGVRAMRVRLDALEIRAEAKLDHLELVDLAQDAMVARLPLHVLAALRPVRDPAQRA